MKIVPFIACLLISVGAFGQKQVTIPLDSVSSEIIRNLITRAQLAQDGATISIQKLEDLQKIMNSYRQPVGKLYEALQFLPTFRLLKEMGKIPTQLQTLAEPPNPKDQVDFKLFAAPKKMLDRSEALRVLLPQISARLIQYSQVEERVTGLLVNRLTQMQTITTKELNDLVAPLMTAEDSMEALISAQEMAFEREFNQSSNFGLLGMVDQAIENDHYVEGQMIITQLRLAIQTIKADLSNAIMEGIIQLEIKKLVPANPNPEGAPNRKPRGKSKPSLAGTNLIA
ncbi:MAG: hypothetical protein IT289_10070 [Oligoflexia bacterium]|nr:hypothetical protein [Oligoflexia bacterium]